jgi:hypothetical protein
VKPVFVNGRQVTMQMLAEQDVKAAEAFEDSIG